MRRTPLFITVFFVGLAASLWLLVEVTRAELPAKAESLAKSAKIRELPSFTQEREAAALTFLRAHHNELADLLTQLKKHNKSEYQQAIRELFRSSERLAQWQEKNPKKYETELALWKLNSRIQLLLAQLSMASDPAVEQQLRQAITEQIEIRRQELLAEKERLSARLSELDQELSLSSAERIDERLQSLLQSAALKKNNSNKPTKKGS